jgi:catechol 2,3-dioxygenase-like lactoylglutathione lyase family enzyme
VLHHLTLWVPDLVRAEASWCWLLCQLGYARVSPVHNVVMLRHPGGLSIALEQSADMVPGMLYSRMRPGLNHLAFLVPDRQVLDRIVADAATHGWTTLPTDGHPIAGGGEVVYLEDRDGFEVELVVPARS